MSKAQDLSFLDRFTNDLDGYFNYYQTLFFIIFSIIIFIIIRVILRRFFKRAFLENKDKDKDKSKIRIKNLIAIKAFEKPVFALTWVILVTFLFKFINPFIHILSDSLFYNILRCALIACLFWFSMSLVSGFRDHYVIEVKKRTGSKDISAVHAVSKLTQILLILIAILFVLPIFNVNIAGLLTVGGVSTIVVGFAAKDMLTNFLGGLMIFFDRPFTVGDWISSPDKKIEGTVEHIGWRMTVIRSFAKQPIYVPNGLFGQIIVVNPSRMTNRRIKKNIGVRYDDASSLPKILQGIRNMLASHPEIDQNKTTLVNLVEFSASSINFMIYTFTKTTEWVKFQMIQDDVMLRCEQIVRDHGAECAFPTTTLHIPDGVNVDLNNKAI